jgi:hypothetical protein
MKETGLQDHHAVKRTIRHGWYRDNTWVIKSSIAWSAAWSTIRQSVADSGRVRTCGIAAARLWHSVNTNTSKLVPVMVSRASIDVSLASVLQCPTYEWIFTLIFWYDFARKLCDRSFNWKTITFGKRTGYKDPAVKRNVTRLCKFIFPPFSSPASFIYVFSFIHFVLLLLLFFACKTQPKYQARLSSVRSICYSLWISSAHCHHNFRSLCLTHIVIYHCGDTVKLDSPVSVTVTPQLYSDKFAYS